MRSLFLLSIADTSSLKGVLSVISPALAGMTAASVVTTKATLHIIRFLTWSSSACAVQSGRPSLPCFHIRKPAEETLHALHVTAVRIAGAKGNYRLYFFLIGGGA